MPTTQAINFCRVWEILGAVLQLQALTPLGLGVTPWLLLLQIGRLTRVQTRSTFSAQRLGHGQVRRNLGYELPPNSLFPDSHGCDLGCGANAGAPYIVWYSTYEFFAWLHLSARMWAIPMTFFEVLET